jgi:signal transduction histidine kinase
MSAKARLLIVDDEPSFCRVIQAFLRGEAYELHTVGCGQEALDVINESPDFDVVLLDLNLPDMNGFKVMEYLSQYAPETLVIIMTGYASLESATEALRCGAHDYLTKPFAREELQKTIQNAMTHKTVKSAHQQAQQALENSERCFRNLVENIVSGVLIVRDGKLLYQNAIQKELFSVITEAVLTCDYKHIYPDDIEKLKPAVKRFLAKEISTAEIDFRYYASASLEGDNELKWVLSRASRISYQGETALLIDTVDISRLKELEHLSLMKNKMHSLGRVAAGIAQEIRNPLTGISSDLFSLKALIDTGLSSDSDKQLARKMTDKIEWASGRIETVISRVMDFAKPDVPLMAKTDINNAIEDAVTLSQMKLRKAGAEVATEYAPDLPACYADRSMIGQVALNIISNAADALLSWGGPRRLRIATCRETGGVRIQVSDSGPGIKESIREMIFDPFFTTKDEGTGIGLNIAQRIVADHHGSIEVSQSAWGGAQFTIHLPVDRRAAAR